MTPIDSELLAPSLAPFGHSCILPAEAVSPPSSGGDNLDAEGAWIGGSMDLYDGVETMSLGGKSHAPNLPHLAEDRTVYYFQPGSLRERRSREAPKKKEAPPVGAGGAAVAEYSLYATRPSAGPGSRVPS